MSTDYKFTIKRKADDKQLGEFYYNWIKNLYDVDCKSLALDPENIAYYSDRKKSVYEVQDIDTDLQKLKEKSKQIWQKIFEKKLLIPHASNIDVKDDLESDIYMLEEEYENVLYAIEALAGLRSTVCVIVEDMVKDGKDIDDSDPDADIDKHMAYVYNAEGLKPEDGNSTAHIWTTDVYLEAEAC